MRALSSATSSHRRPSSWRPTRAYAVPYSNARSGDSSSSVGSRAPRYAMTSVWRPAAASSWALSTTIDDVRIAWFLAYQDALPSDRVLREMVQRGRDHLLRGVVLRPHLPPGLRPRPPVPDRELIFQDLIGGVHDAIAVQIGTRVLIPEASCAGLALENNTPDGWKSTLKNTVSIVSVIRTESPRASGTLPAPATSPLMGILNRRNGSGSHWPGRRR